MSTAATTSPQRLTNVLLPKLPILERLQLLVYGSAATQVAGAICIAGYVLITQARYFGATFKYTWDNMDTLWFHLQNVPKIGGWLVDHWKIFEHIFMRNDPEAVLAAALVSLLIIKKISLKDKTPIIDRMLCFLRMPSLYQGRVRGEKHERTSALQIIFLFPSMLVAAIFGEALIGIPIFIGIALAHRHGYHAAWLTPEAGWVSGVIGTFGGLFYGHKPALKVGRDVQEHFIHRRLAAAYHAEVVLKDFKAGRVELETARDDLTGLPDTEPNWYYPPLFRHWYRALLGEHVQMTNGRGKMTTFVITAVLPVVTLLAFYGFYIRYVGIPVQHGKFWMP